MRKYAEDAASWFHQTARLEFVPWQDWKTTVTERDAEITLDHIAHSPHASIDKAERVLGFRPRFTATDAVRDALGF